MMKLLLVLALVAHCYSASIDDKELYEKYQQFKADFKKAHNGVEDSKRYNIFRNNLIRIEEHNKKFDAGEVSFSMGINQFTDMTIDEITGGYREVPKHNDEDVYDDEDAYDDEDVYDDEDAYDDEDVCDDEDAYDDEDDYDDEDACDDEDVYDDEDVSDLEEAVDWRDKGAVNPVKDQKECLSCYAFSATGSMEGAHQIKKGVLLSFSEQNLVDCREGTGGCEDGGTMVGCFEYVIKNKGIDTEDAYPYLGKTQECKFNQSGIGTQLSGYKNIESGNEKALQNAVAKIGPISVAIVATDKFQLYRTGIFEDESCKGANLNHGVLAVGYGTEDGKDFWLVKNSWGEKWGEKGYIKMARNKDNNCGIATDASYPIIA